MLNTPRKQAVVNLTRDLIRQKGLAGQERGVAEVVITAMHALGYDAVRVDELGNVIGLLNASQLAVHGALLFDSHMDTVEAAGRWTKDPFGGEVSDGRVWGRGASDMKGALAASLC